MNENVIACVILFLYFTPVFYQLGVVIKERKRGNKLPLKKLLKFLKYSFCVLLPLLIGFFVISHTNYLNYEKPITYDKVDQITFENFRGLEFFKKSLYGNKQFAYVVTTVDSEIKDDYVKIVSYFHPSRSYVYNTHSNSKDLLTHEIYHFKITELYARIAKNKIAMLKDQSYSNIETIIEKEKLKEIEFQKKYDYDTFHSYVYSEQKKYEKEIDSLLSLYREYKTPKIHINVKN